ncbi:hypothetical protein SAMN05443529_103240 [Desulfosporosinus hippei DSM 8344]|uniref:Uncharacterized protein n=1 Tax=Desulfosporosinus hippei DSM 8344 TaxID=1121419 RepID=A0A1G7UST9_9FIRM|nr:hypothetical protein SAMN05443529_103240 [Desulfosporosinus hippei DSM 8344]
MHNNKAFRKSFQVSMLGHPKEGEYKCLSQNFVLS